MRDLNWGGEKLQLNFLPLTAAFFFHPSSLPTFWSSYILPNTFSPGCPSLSLINSVSYTSTGNPEISCLLSNQKAGYSISSSLSVPKPKPKGSSMTLWGAPEYFKGTHHVGPCKKTRESMNVAEGPQEECKVQRRLGKC